jgi:hypothetical protein
MAHLLGGGKNDAFAHVYCGGYYFGYLFSYVFFSSLKAI